MEKDTTAQTASGIATSEYYDTTTGSGITLTATKIEARIDSRLLSNLLGNQHQSVFGLLKIHRADFEELGLLRFQTGKGTVGRPEKFAMLNEDQAYLLLAYSRNNAKTRRLKIKLVKAFSEARRAADMRRTEYLPTYHRLQDAIHAAAAGSANERCVHINIAKLLNKTVGIDAGQRAAAPVPKQALLIVGQMMAAQDMQSAPNHRDGYQRVKQSMLALSGIAMLGAP
jgi:phage regulator Rha-like protein